VKPSWNQIAPVKIVPVPLVPLEGAVPRPNPYGWKNLRNAGGQPPAGDAPAGPAHPHAPPASRRKSRRWRVVLAGLFVGALSAGILLLILWLGRSDYPEVVIVAPLGKNLAHPDNDLGKKPADALSGWASEGVKNRAKLADPVAAEPADRDRWRKAIGSRLLAPTGGLVLYFAAPVGADAKGPFVWLPPVAPTAGLTDADKLPVSQILTALKDRGGPKLLVFDVTPTPANWAANGVFNDFARALREMDAEIEGVPDLAVVCSADADQAAWAADDTQATVFGHHFTEGVRGAGHAGNEQVTGESLFTKVLAKEVNLWARRHRLVSQTPVLLPEKSGAVRAAAVKLGVVPPDGYTPPPVPAPAKPDLKPLEEEWREAEKLAAKFPDRTDPAAWRQYLDRLLRWEFRVRYNLPVGDAPAAVRGVRRQLEAAATPQYPFVSLGAPIESAASEKLKFEALWEKGTDTIAEAWGRQAGDQAAAPAYRRWVAEQVLDRVSRVGPTAATLKRAAEVVAEVDALLDQRPVETHLLRMLHEHLDPTRRDDPALHRAVKAALELRREAERAAWGESGPPAYPEQVFRWTRQTLTAADADRQRGEDLLFDGNPESWKRAEGLFAGVRPKYEAARKRVEVVSAGLAARDRVFARLPYYVRWVAGRQATADGELLVRQLEAAAEKAHELNDRLAAPPAKEAEVAAAVVKLDADTTAAAAAFRTVEEAYRHEVTRLKTASANPADWHALDAAAGVPFLPAADRLALFEKLVSVTQALRAGEDRPELTAPTPDARAIALGQARIARAYLGNPTVLIPLDAAEPHKAFRDAADRLGQRLRGAPEQADQRYREAIGAKPLIDQSRYRADAAGDPPPAEKPLADAARTVRLSDPAAAVAVKPDPVDADRRYWRHEFLLWQTARTIRDGWADVGQATVVTDPARPIDTARWYCKVTAAKLIGEAREAVRGLIAQPTAEQQAALEAACATAATLDPVLVLPTADAEKLIIQDDRKWAFPFQFVFAGADRPAGFPTYWLDVPPEYREPNKDRLARRVAANDARTPDAAPVYQTAPPAGGGRRELVSNALYRGHLARRFTALGHTGPPTIEVIAPPPTGPARLALRADPGVVTGAVTVLIDRSTSMWRENGIDTLRYKQAFVGLRNLLDALPDGTLTTVAWFDQVNGANRLSTFGKPGPLEKTKHEHALDQFGVKREDDLKPVEDRVAKTPLAASVQELLSATRRAEFWPADYTGARTVVVLTDGADTVAEKKAAGLIKDALAQADGAVHLHIVFFDMNSSDAKAADEQYKPLEGTGELGKQLVSAEKSPVLLSRDVKTGKEFADAVIRSFRPVVRYEQVGGRAKGNLAATLTDNREWAYLPSKDLPAGWYKLTSGRSEWTLDVAAGEQLVIGVGRAGERLRVSVPPTAHALANWKPDQQFPSATAGGRVYATLPAARFSNGTGVAKNLDLKFTLERDADAGEKELRRNRPVFPWFHVTDPDTPAALPRMRVVTDPTLVAPAWDVSLLDWDGSADARTGVRRPAVVANWIDTAVLDAALKEVLPPGVDNRLDLAALGLDAEPHPVADRVSARLETRDGDTFLTVEVDYEAAGKLPYLRAVGWGANAPAERHAYYDPDHRYTVRYGPLKPDQRKAPLTFHRFSVADLRAKAEAAGKAARVGFPNDRVRPFDRTPNLLFGAGK
jgi:hypothetical protein